jgi:uncharacterized membrane protein
MIAMLALYSLGGLIIAGISVPLILYKIPPNSFFGFRNQSTRDNPRLWYKINAYAGKRLLVTGLGTAVGSNILYYLSASPEEYALSCLGVFLALFLWTMITSFLYMRANR